jgi:hypothetical protein
MDGRTSALLCSSVTTEAPYGSSRRTLAWRISALRSAMLLFRPLVLLLARYAPVSKRCYAG